MIYINMYYRSARDHPHEITSHEIAGILLESVYVMDAVGVVDVVTLHHLFRGR